MNGALAPNGRRSTQPKRASTFRRRLRRSEPALAQPEPAMPRVEPAPLPAPVVHRQQEEVRIASAPRRRRGRSSREPCQDDPPKPAASAKKVRREEDGPLFESVEIGRGVGPDGAHRRLRQPGEGQEGLVTARPAVSVVQEAPAVVTDLPSRTAVFIIGFQIGTTSQAHSEVLCQRMRAIGQSCAGGRSAGRRRGAE